MPSSTTSTLSTRIVRGRSQRNWQRVRAALVVVFMCVVAAYAAAAQQPVSQPAPQDPQAMQLRIDRLEETLKLVQAQLAALQNGQSASTSQNTAPPAPPQVHVAPDMAPGSATPTSSAVNPVAVATATLGERLPTAAEEQKHKFFERKPGRDLTFYTRQGEITAYGNLDISIDVLTKGTRGFLDSNGNPPVGNMGWLPDISTNLSYIGVRGTQATGIKNLNFVYQLETQLDIASTSGSGETNSTQDNAVKGALTSRNSFIGLGSPSWGAIVFGKTDAPYKLSTARLNPFVAMIGDYAAIMGNTGGDTRVEFGTRLDHSIWYTSSKFDGFEFSALFSPGQNRSDISNNLAAGEPDCTGGDNPGDGGDVPLGCNDGGFSDAVSTSVTYTKEPLYIVAAYERHRKVNRQSDLTGLYANVPTQFFNADVADEDAGKVGIQYTLAHRTTVSALYETLHRYVPDFLEFQNERQRQG